MEYNNDELYHYGRLGMKWGQHIYGKARASVKRSSKATTKSTKSKSSTSETIDSAKKKFSLFKKKTTKKVQELEKQHEQKTEAQKAKEKAAKKESVLKSRSAKQLYENADLFTDQELQTAYNRLVLERNIKNLSPKEVSKGQQYVNTAIKVTKTTASLLESGTKAYNAFAKIYNATESGQKKAWPIVGGNNKKKEDKE